jgi:pimeloyl-ACP methyl ester carboxylesterase/DNA-binding CsgD family transcriptional regulator
VQSEIKYATSGDVNLAYQVVGEGDLDLIFVPGFFSHVLVGWEEPRLARFLRRLASFSRLVIFDKRGTGMSDPIAKMPTQRDRVDDIRAVMDATGVERGALFGVSEGGTLCTAFAATYPHRAAALVTFGASAKVMRSPDWPWGWPEARYAEMLARVEANWANSAVVRNPTLEGDERYHQWFVRFLQVAASPGMARTLMQLNATVDIRPVLPRLKVPALILHRVDDPIIAVEQSRYLAAHIPGARLLELEGVDHWPWIGESDQLLDEVEVFLTGQVRKVGRRPVLGPEALSHREKQIIRLALEGYSAAEIGKELFISKRTVESHLANTYVKLGVESKVQLARKAAELDL